MTPSPAGCSASQEIACVASCQVVFQHYGSPPPFRWTELCPHTGILRLEESVKCNNLSEDDDDDDEFGDVDADDNDSDKSRMS